MSTCKTCLESYEEEAMINSGICKFCNQKEEFAAFARSSGLQAYPDPTGERYVYTLTGCCLGKKGECPGFMDELWNALVRAKGGNPNLLIRKG